MYSYDDIDHIRRRPGMYVGGTDSRALHLMVDGVIEYMLDRYAASKPSIDITLHPGYRVTISDNGRGIPVDRVLHPESNIPVSKLELAMTRSVMSDLEKGEPVRLRSMGVGLRVVNGLSAELKVEVRRDGFLWEQLYHAGRATTDVQQVRALLPDETTGTFITFMPDFTIFQPNEFDHRILGERIQNLVYLIPGLSVKLKDENSSPIVEGTFCAPRGLYDFIHDLNHFEKPLHEIICGNRSIVFKPRGQPASHSYSMEILIAFQYIDSDENIEFSFVNRMATCGGTHLAGLRAGITKGINQAFQRVGLLASSDRKFVRKEARMGLTAVVSVTHPSPIFASQMRYNLKNQEVKRVVAKVVYEVFDEFAEQNPDEVKVIFRKYLDNKLRLENITRDLS